MIKSIKEIPVNNVLTGGTSACAGCASLIALKLILKVLGEDTIICNPASCSTLFAMYPHSPFDCSWIHSAFENMGSTASGIRHSLDAQGIKDTNVLVYAGDGSCYDIGFQALSFAALNNENIIYVCYNNAGYSNTGFQWSTATPYGADTKTQPRGVNAPLANHKEPKDMIKIMASHGKHMHVSTANVSYPVDLINKIERAKNYTGFSYIEVLIPCCTGWGFESSQTISIGREADQTGSWPLLEIEDRILTLNKKYNNLKPIDNYVKIQGRYKALPEDGIKELQKLTIDRMIELKERNGKVYV